MKVSPVTWGIIALLLVIIAPMILTAQSPTAHTLTAANLTPTLDQSASQNPQQQFVPTIDPFPRPTNYEIIVAEQVFENGRMFYLLPADRIWVMFNEADSTSTQGTWEIYENPFAEGQREADPGLEAPDDLTQPIRGFGKIWRDNRDIASAFGWGLEPEIGHYTQYRFFPGERTLEGDKVVIQPGYHALVSYYGGIFVFNEAEKTWCLFEGDTTPCIDDTYQPIIVEALAQLEEAEAIEENIVTPEASATP